VAHDCQVTAELGGTTYSCQEHKGGKHVFAAHWPKCPAPWCRLPPGHRSLHDVPAGTPKITVPVPEIRALTVRQPYAGAIAFGGKTPENRPMRSRYTGLVAIHAGMTVDWDAAGPAWTAARVTPYRRGLKRAAWTGVLDLGAVIAVATMTGCHNADECMFPEWSLPPGGQTGCSPWAVRGAWHWELTGVHPLAEPVSCRGMLGLWRLPEDAEKAVRAQLEEAGRA
jgi:hypothetical protein